MLPMLLFNMEGTSNSFNSENNSFSSVYDDNVILNSVRSRKKVSELPNCPVCSCTVRQGELESHLALEVDRLQKLSSGSKRKLSVNSASGAAMPGSSSTADVPDDQEVDVTGCPGSDVYQRVHTNRLRRLRTRRRSPLPPHTQQGECPVCNATLPVSRLQRHALRCLKRTGAEMDEDVPDTSSEDGSIDVENDIEQEAGAGGSFGAEYRWCGSWRVRAAALQRADERPAVCVAPADSDAALVVDGDEDAELYGPPQYSPSRIAPDSEPVENGHADEPRQPSPCEDAGQGDAKDTEQSTPKHNGLVEASAETRIQALKARIRELEARQNVALENKCLICLGPHTSPAVSIQCWHVYCEVCWLQSLRAKKICPQCNAITTTQHLRRIYM